MRIYNWYDVERITGISEHRLKYAVKKGRLGGFAMVNGAFVFCDEDVERIETYFAGLKPWQRASVETNQQKGQEQ